MSFPGVNFKPSCASGMQACVFGYEAIACGDKDVVVTGGVDSENVYPIMADMNVATVDQVESTLPLHPIPKSMLILLSKKVIKNMPNMNPGCKVKFMPLKLWVGFGEIKVV